MIAEYKQIKIHQGATGIVRPGWVIDGGHFENPDNHTLIGIVLPENEREYYVPDTVKYLTRGELIARALDIHSRFPMKKPVMTGMGYMNDAEVTQRVNEWCDQKNQN